MGIGPYASAQPFPEHVPETPSDYFAKRDRLKTRNERDKRYGGHSTTVVQQSLALASKITGEDKDPPGIEPERTVYVSPEDRLARRLEHFAQEHAEPTTALKDQPLPFFQQAAE